MREIKVLGPGCDKCRQLMKLTEQAVEEMSLDCRIEKVTDIQEITSFGVMMTPALVVDGVVKITGKVPSIDQIKGLLSQGA